MSLALATLLPGVVMVLLGLLFLANNSATVSMIRSFPRSMTAACIFFGGGAAWFLWIVRGLSEADLILFDSPTPLLAFFAILAVLAFIYVPDFLAVRGLSILILLGSMPVLMAVYGEYEYNRRLFMVAPVILVAVPIAIYLGASPYRLRDFNEWLFRRPGRARVLGAGLVAYGLLLFGVSFTY